MTNAGGLCSQDFPWAVQQYVEWQHSVVVGAIATDVSAWCGFRGAIQPMLLLFLLLSLLLLLQFLLWWW
jgi:hypothetical protein